VGFATIGSFSAALALPAIVLGEELVWRGLVHDAWPRRFTPVAKILLGALAYALVDLATGSPVLMATAFVCGTVWATLRSTTGGLLAPVASHLVWDLLVLFVHRLV
jgi:uncharacterized protein